MSNKVVPTRITAAATPTTAYTSPSNTATLDAIKVVANAATTAGKIKVEFVRGANTRTLGWIEVPATNPTTSSYYEQYTLMLNANFQTGDIIQITTHESVTYDFFLFVTE